MNYYSFVRLFENLKESRRNGSSPKVFSDISRVRADREACAEKREGGGLGGRGGGGKNSRKFDYAICFLFARLSIRFLFSLFFFHSTIRRPFQLYV